jgi:hypothetical protein
MVRDSGRNLRSKLSLSPFQRLAPQSAELSSFAHLAHLAHLDLGKVDETTPQRGRVLSKVQPVSDSIIATVRFRKGCLNPQSKHQTPARIIPKAIAAVLLALPSRIALNNPNRPHPEVFCPGRAASPTVAREKCF